MTAQTSVSSPAQYSAATRMLLELGLPIHRIGFHQLFIAIPRFAQDPTQSLTRELYPYIAEYFNCPDCRSIEKSIRDVISYAWANGDPSVWQAYFPGLTKPPSNRLFISTFAYRLK